MVLDRSIQQRLSDGRIIDLAVTVAAIADQIHDYVALEGVAVFERHAADANHRVHIFGVDVKDRNRLAARQLRGKTRRMLLVVQRGESEQVVGDDVHRAAHGIALEVGKD